MRPFAALLALVLAVGFPAPATAEPDITAQPEIPPQEPGVTLRAFDVRVPWRSTARSNPARHPTSTS